MMTSDRGRHHILNRKSLRNKIDILTVPENVWKIDELVLDESKDVDFTRSDKNSWWNSEPLKTLDLGSNVINIISPKVKLLQELVTLKVNCSM